MQLEDIWKVNSKTWYSEKLIDKIINLCKRTKEACEKGFVKDNSLADDILKLLDYKNSKGDK